MMSRNSTKSDLSLKWLELFQICAQKGSLQAVSRETGLSVSTVSHHLKNLETHLGVELFDHTRRPMILTPKGRAFLRNIDDALLTIRKATAEASAGEITDTSYLRIGTMEDFDSDIIPELAVMLNKKMPRCEFLFRTDTSHSLIDMMRNRKLDLGITTAPIERMRDLLEQPILRDPFIVVLPTGYDRPVSEVVEGHTSLPFLRFENNQIIARQIEAQLRRMGLSLPRRFECSNNQTLMAMVAAGAGWTITTPLLFSRAQRFHGQVNMHTFPGKSFARNVILVATPDCSESVLKLVGDKMRILIERFAIKPILQSSHWLSDDFMLINTPPSD